VLILPRFGLLSQIILYHTDIVELGRFYRIVWAVMRIRFLGCVVWAHHMFTVRLDNDTRVYFTAATIVIGVPTGVKIFTWLSLLLRKEVNIDGSYIWVIGFLFLFTLRRVTGITLANNSLDLVLHDTYFVVAHFHYVLSISAVYSLVIRFCHWQELFVYRICDEFLNKIYFYTLFIRVNITFFPMHQMRILRIPRRYFSYGEVYMNLNIVTFMRTLFTILRWIILSLLIYNTHKMILKGSGYVSYPESVNGNNAPWHTFMEWVASYFYDHIKGIACVNRGGGLNVPLSDVKIDYLFSGGPDINRIKLWLRPEIEDYSMGLRAQYIKKLLNQGKSQGWKIESVQLFRPNRVCGWVGYIGDGVWDFTHVSVHTYYPGQPYGVWNKEREYLHYHDWSDIQKKAMEGLISKQTFLSKDVRQPSAFKMWLCRLNG